MTQYIYTFMYIWKVFETAAVDQRWRWDLDGNQWHNFRQSENITRNLLDRIGVATCAMCSSSLLRESLMPY